MTNIWGMGKPMLFPPTAAASANDDVEGGKPAAAADAVAAKPDASDAVEFTSV